jgi:hypothetical protein
MYNGLPKTIIVYLFKDVIGVHDTNGELWQLAMLFIMKVTV